MHVSHQQKFNKPIEICDECLKPMQTDIKIGDFIRRMRIACECQRAEFDEIRRITAQRDFDRKLDRYREYSLADKNFKNSTFDNWIFRDNQKLYDIGKKYCDKWPEIFANNRGLLLHGVSGNGKTYLSYSIANELHRRGVTVLAISAGRILKIIQDGYVKYGSNENVREIEILNAIRDAELLILDDLGIEQKSYWSYEKIYSVIDTRSRAKKPLIVTTNLDLNELRENLSIVDARTGKRDTSDRIYNRIVEICANFEVTGKSWRIHNGMENKKALLELLDA